jgi:hypothetical protein
MIGRERVRVKYLDGDTRAMIAGMIDGTWIRGAGRGARDGGAMTW